MFTLFNICIKLLLEPEITDTHVFGNISTLRFTFKRHCSFTDQRCGLRLWSYDKPYPMPTYLGLGLKVVVFNRN